MSKRSIAVTAAIAGAAALAATGINYAAAAGTEAAPAAAPAVRQAAAPAAAPLGGDSGQGKEKDNDYNKGNDHYRYEGRIQINERSYSAGSDGCITVVSGLGANSFNVRNDSWKTVEVFRGATCDNGAPVATVGPWSTSNSVSPHRVRGGVFVKHGVVGSFRVVHEFRGGHGGGGYGGGGYGGGGYGGGDDGGKW
ncbi:hypothetical protein ACFVY1_05015 [Streptomyces sp. NPDC058293]|nr:MULTISPECIES: hypothetical protein [unclassified Streptomyces]MCX4645603.1 hypothetical protein [Streptomyces sp. NBC_01446]MCX5318229.1 hypothetical protein [Streptomyces sp. NBC_00120]